MCSSEEAEKRWRWIDRQADDVTVCRCVSIGSRSAVCCWLVQSVKLAGWPIGTRSIASHYRTPVHTLTHPASPSSRQHPLTDKPDTLTTHSYTLSQPGPHAPHTKVHTHVHCETQRTPLHLSPSSHLTAVHRMLSVRVGTESGQVTNTEMTHHTPAMCEGSTIHDIPTHVTHRRHTPAS